MKQADTLRAKDSMNVLRINGMKEPRIVPTVYILN